MGVSRRRFLWTTGAVGLALPGCASVQPAEREATAPTLAAADAAPAPEATRGLVDVHMGHAPDAIRLNKNENPFGPSPKAMAAIRDGIAHSHRYVRSSLIRERLAEVHGVQPDMIRLGTGSGEVLRALPLSHLDDGGNVVAFRQAYSATPSKRRRWARR